MVGLNVRASMHEGLGEKDNGALWERGIGYFRLWINTQHLFVGNILYMGGFGLFLFPYPITDCAAISHDKHGKTAYHHHTDSSEKIIIRLIIFEDNGTLNMFFFIKTM